MIFISLVENAFKHGISPTEPSFIRINIDANEQTIVCCIENSNNPKSSSDHSGHGIGLQQVGRRLELAYPEKYIWQQGTKDNDKIYYSKITIQL
jgi:LytS/YehU family sensor histidine kinase